MQIDDQSSGEKDKKILEANMTLGDENKFAVPEIMDKQIDVSLDPKKHLGQKKSGKSQVKIKLKQNEVTRSKPSPNESDKQIQILKQGRESVDYTKTTKAE